MCQLAWDLNSDRYNRSQTNDLNNSRTRYHSPTALTALSRHATIGSSVKAVKVELNTMRRHTGGGSVNTCRIPPFWLAELANTCRKAKGRLAQLLFPERGLRYWSPRLGNLKAQCFLPEPWDGWPRLGHVANGVSRITVNKEMVATIWERSARWACVRWAWRQCENCSVKSFFCKKQRINAKSEPSKCSRLALSRHRQIYAMIGVELRTYRQIFVKSWRRSAHLHTSRIIVVKIIRENSLCVLCALWVMIYVILLA